MTQDEITERGLYADENGLIFDQYGNEYRDENGGCCYLYTDTMTTNTEQGVTNGRHNYV